MRKSFKYIPFTNENNGLPSNKLKLDSVSIRKAFKSNPSLTKSFCGVQKLPKEQEYNNNKKPNAGKTNKCRPCQKRKTHKAHEKRKRCKPSGRKHKRCRKPRVLKVQDFVFFEKVFKGILSDNQFQQIPEQNTAYSTNIMYMVVNQSHDATVEAQIEISPDGKEFFVDTAQIFIEPESNYVVIPLRFAKFTRVSYRTIEEGKTAVVDIFYQTQTGIARRKKKER